MADNVKIPKVSVLMPVYNCELYIQEAIDSILNQTFADFEFVIIDDASTDHTASIIKAYNDSRIRLIEKPFNTGLTNSLNLGLELAKGKYIARMDGDDISLPKRFEKQVAFLDENLDFALCGTWYKFIDLDVVIEVPKDHEAIKLALLRGNTIAHPSVMMRKEVLDVFPIVYDVMKEPAEDYALWVRILEVGKLYNLQEVLLNYRLHVTQVSHKRANEQTQATLEIRLEMLKYINHFADKEDADLLRRVISKSLLIDFKDFKRFFALKQKLILANSNNFFDSYGFEKYLLELQRQIFKKYFIKRQKYSPIICFHYFIIKKSADYKLKLIDELKLMVKSMVFFERK